MGLRQLVFVQLGRFAVMCYFYTKSFGAGIIRINDEKREPVMKITVAGIVLGFMALACSPPSANAATPYVSGSIGLASLGDSELTARSYDTGCDLVGAIGLDGGQYRLEAELGHQKNGVHNSDASESMTTVMGNGYINLDLPFSPLKPFVIAGVGMAKVDEDNGFGSTVDDTVFAWQFGGGAGISVAPFTILDAQYRYFSASSAELAGNHKYSIGTHNVMLGLRIGF